MTTSTLLDGPTPCPHDPGFAHDNYHGCVPADFSERTGRSKHRQIEHQGRWFWDGGCDAHHRLAEHLETP